MVRSEASIEKIEGSVLTMSEVSLILNACQVTEKQPDGVILTDGSAIVIVLSSKRSNVVVLTVQAFSVRAGNYPEHP